MWFLLIIILLVPTNGLGMMCNKDPDSFCGVPGINLDHLPKNEHELHTICPVVTDNLECLHSYDLACRGRSVYEALPGPLDYHRMISFANDACEESNKVHRVLALNLPCIQNRITARDYTCSRSRDKVLQAYEVYVSTHSEYSRRVLTSTGKEDRRYCLSNVYTTGCVLKDIEKECGYSVYEIGMRLVRTNILVDDCGVDIFEELAEIVDDLKVDRKHKAILEELFPFNLE